MKQVKMLRLLFIATALLGYLTSVGNDQPGSKYFQNIIVVTLDAKGIAHIGKDTFDMEGLSHELQQRFWKSFMGTGKMQDQVRLEYTSKVSAEIIKATTAAIKKGQQDALVDLSLQLYKKRYEDLSFKQQKKIKAKYPILFQQKFS